MGHAAGAITPRMIGALLGIVIGVAVAFGVKEAIESALTNPPTGAGGFAFVRSVAGDRATIWAVGDGDASRRGRAVADRIASSRFDRLLYLGDVYEHGTAKQFRANFASTYGRLARRTAPTPGNHDWPNHASGYDPYWRTALDRTRTASWYAFSAGGWRILSLNSESDHGTGSPQERWLRAQLRERGGTCRIAFWHRPRHSAGRHGDQADMEPIWSALRGRAAIVLNGHDHDMQRLHPIDGITTFVSGAGGHSSYGVDRSDDRVAFSDDEREGALRLRLSPGKASYAFISAPGRVLDSGTLRCRR
ncbi:MAG: metallophosphoesterase family protein [Solirubrobacteraceae bacterium]